MVKRSLESLHDIPCSSAAETATVICEIVANKSRQFEYNKDAKYIPLRTDTIRGLISDLSGVLCMIVEL